MQTSTGDDVKDLVIQMKNKLTRKYRRKPPKKAYHSYKLEEVAEDRYIITLVQKLFCYHFFLYTMQRANIRIFKCAQQSTEPISQVNVIM